MRYHLAELGIDLALTVTGAKLFGFIGHSARSLASGRAAGRLWHHGMDVVNAGFDPAPLIDASSSLIRRSDRQALLAGASVGLTVAKLTTVNWETAAAGVVGGAYEAAKWSPAGALISGYEAVRACSQGW